MRIRAPPLPPLIFNSQEFALLVQVPFLRGSSSNKQPVYRNFWSIFFDAMRQMLLEKIDHISCSNILTKNMKLGIWRWPFASESRCQARKLHPAESGAWVVSNCFSWCDCCILILLIDDFPLRFAEFFSS